MQRRRDKCSTVGRGRLSGRVDPVVAAAVLAVLGLASCSSGGGGDLGAAPTVDSEVTVTDSNGPDFVPTDGDDADADAGSPTTLPPGLAPQPTDPPIDPIPESGVPGIDSTDAFCRAWSEFAGSFQALGLVSVLGDPAEALRLEVIAASTVATAVEALDANLPAELEAERAALVTELAGPFARRAEAAEAALTDAGVDPDSLRDVWIEAVTESGVDDPDMTIELPADIDAVAVDAAVASFAAAQPAIIDDVTLVTDAAVPETESYLASACPDGGILGGNDVILS